MKEQVLLHVRVDSTAYFLLNYRHFVNRFSLTKIFYHGKPLIGFYNLYHYVLMQLQNVDLFQFYMYLILCNKLYLFSVSVSLSMSDRLVSKSVMPVGNYIAWSTESNLTVRCPLIRPSAVETIPSTPFSVKLVPENMFPEPFSSISSQLLLVS